MNGAVCRAYGVTTQHWTTLHDTTLQGTTGRDTVLGQGIGYVHDGSVHVCMENPAIEAET